jgi:hypothetical protein
MHRLHFRASGGDAGIGHHHETLPVSAAAGARSMADVKGDAATAERPAHDDHKAVVVIGFSQDGASIKQVRRRKMRPPAPDRLRNPRDWSA